MGQFLLGSLGIPVLWLFFVMFNPDLVKHRMEIEYRKASCGSGKTPYTDYGSDLIGEKLINGLIESIGSQY